MMGDILDVLSMVIMGLLILLLVWAALAVILWATQRGAQLWESVENALTNIKRSRADAKLVTMRPGEVKITRDELKEMTAEIVRAQFDLATRQLEAMKLPANVPQTITYSPHYAPHMRNQVEQGAAATLADLPKLAAPPVDFWTLYHQGALPDNGFLLGYGLDDGAPVLANWQKLYSALIGGQSGSGKSTLIRCLLAQSAMQGGRFVVIDPHMGSGDESLAESLAPLRGLMLTAPASTDDEIRDALKFVEATGRARLAGKDPDRTPLILVVDELTGMLARGAVKEELLAGLGLIAQETRKVGVYALGIGQQFQAELFPSTVRNAFVSYVSCRARRETARTMSGSNDFGKLAEGLTTGQAVWMTPQGEVSRLAVPNTTARHVELVAKQVAAGAWDATGPHVSPHVTPTALPMSSEAPETPVDMGADMGADMGEYTSTTLVVDSARAARVRAGIKSGMTKGQVLKDVWGVDSKTGGKRASQAGREYDEIVRALVG